MESLPPKYWGGKPGTKPKISLEREMRRKYDLREEILAEARFVQLETERLSAIDFVVIGVGTKNLIVARVAHIGTIAYELISVTPLSEVTVVASKKTKRIQVISRYKLFRPAGEYELCSCADQERVWQQFTYSIGVAMFLHMQAASCRAILPSLNLPSDPTVTKMMQVMAKTEGNLNYSCSRQSHTHIACSDITRHKHSRTILNFDGPCTTFDGALATFDGALATFDTTFDGARTTFDGALATFDGALATFDGARATFDGALATFDGALARFDSVLATFDGARSTLGGARSKFNGALATFDGYHTKFENSRTMFDGAQTTFDGVLATFVGALATFDGVHTKKFDGALATFDVANIKFENARTTFNGANTKFGGAHNAFDGALATFEVAHTKLENARTSFYGAHTKFGGAHNAFDGALTTFDNAHTAFDGARTSFYGQIEPDNCDLSYNSDSTDSDTDSIWHLPTKDTTFDRSHTTFYEQYVPKECDWYYNSDPDSVFHLSSNDNTPSSDTNLQVKPKKKKLLSRIWKGFKRLIPCIPRKHKE